MQRAILDAGARATRPGGSLVYSTCTISPAENAAVVEAFLDRRAGFELGRGPRPTCRCGTIPRVPGFSQTLPHRDGTEGFFVARLRRREAA